MPDKDSESAVALRLRQTLLDFEGDKLSQREAIFNNLLSRLEDRDAFIDAALAILREGADFLMQEDTELHAHLLTRRTLRLALLSVLSDFDKPEAKAVLREVAANGDDGCEVLICLRGLSKDDFMDTRALALSAAQRFASREQLGRLRYFDLTGADFLIECMGAFSLPELLPEAETYLRADQVRLPLVAAIRSLSPELQENFILRALAPPNRYDDWFLKFNAMGQLDLSSLAVQDAVVALFPYCPSDSMKIGFVEAITTPVRLVFHPGHFEPLELSGDRSEQFRREMENREKLLERLERGTNSPYVVHKLSKCRQLLSSWTRLGEERRSYNPD